MNAESRNVGLQSNSKCLEAARNDKVIQGGTELQQVATQRGWHVPTQRGAQTLHGTSKGGLTAQLKLSPGVNRKIQHQRPRVYPRAET